jgi:aminopeptidase N
VVPLSYDLTLAPDAASGRFRGREEIEVNLRARTAAIRLDSADLRVSEASISHYHVRVRSEGEAIWLLLPHALPPGRATIALSWEGHLSSNLYGLYADGRNLFTQLEPDHARSVFPCFDEPGLRARFRVHATIPVGKRAISNGEVEAEHIQGNRKKVDFAETPPLPTYLVALAVGDFHSVAANFGELPVRVLFPPGHQAAAAAALATAGQLLRHLENYLGVPYPFAKLDIVAVPQLAIHGMENAAAIFVRADELLGPDETQTRRLAHELAHQWFGDLVTMSTWQDLWLSEALARWAEFQITDDIHPDWQMWNRFQRLRNLALSLDAGRSAHAIRGAKPRFDEITYDKGAAALWMLQRWIGDEPFRAALREYLTGHRFAVASADDFWRAIAAWSSDEIAALGRTWFDQPGHPTVTIDTHCVGGALRVRLRQHREGEPSRQTWQVPVTLQIPSGSLRLIMRAPERTLLIREAGGCPGFVHAEPDGVQPYRYVLGAERYSRVTSASSMKPTTRPASSVTTSSRAP